MSDSQKMPVVIAIDGPAASGKGTLARRIAESLGFALLDTGALYRAVALLVSRSDGDHSDPTVAIAAARDLTPAKIAILTDDPELRRDSTAALASQVSAIPEVRAALLTFQRDFAAHPPDGRPGAVLDGRDIGTIICPTATAKLFVTAAVEIRAERRFAELQNRQEPAIYAAVLKDMQDRDTRDSQRTVAPLRSAADALVIDSSALTADQAFDAAMAFIRTRLAAASP